MTRRILAPILSLIGARKKTSKKRTWRARDVERTLPPRAVAEPSVRHLPEATEGSRVVPLESTERTGAARDERSFEQKRRGGPVTGEAPFEVGPRHQGGSRRRGRDAVTNSILDDINNEAA